MYPRAPLDDLSEPTTRASVTPERPPDVRLVADDAALAPLVERLAALGATPVAVDTEADSFHHYFEKACLLQLGDGESAWLVDPLSTADLSPLFALLARAPLLMHGADYDLRLLKRGWGFQALSVFDTMIAAQLLGEKEIGLAALLKARVGVTLDKSSQRDDWSERPLTPVRIAYAAKDVLHLHELAASLSADLEAKGRLAWHAEECARLVAAELAPKPSDPENGWRFKGTNALSDRERAFARAFWEVRDARARLLDRPPFRVMTNDRIVAAAKAAVAAASAQPGAPPPDIAALFPSNRPMPPGFLRDLDDARRRAAALPREEWPRPRRGEAPAAVDPALERAVEGLRKKRDALAVALAIDPSVLAPRAALSAAARVRLDTGRLVPDDLVEKAGLARWRADLLCEAAATP